MDARHLDDLCRVLAALVPRRGLLGGLAGGLLALLALAPTGEHAAARHKRRKHKKRRRKKKRCTKVGNSCTPDGRRCCAPLRCDTSIDTFTSGQTVCCASTEGASCTDNVACCTPLLCSTETNTCFFRS